MEILFKQLEQNTDSGLRRYGIEHCYFKKIAHNHNHKNSIGKVHHHTTFEFHIVTEGSQEYDVAGVRYQLEPGTFLMIYPNIPHCIVASTPYMKKYAITFNKPMEPSRSCFCGTATPRLLSNFDFICQEATLKKESSHTLIENGILECLVSIFRLSGIKEKDSCHRQDDHIITSLAKKYIEDNIQLNPSVPDVSEYCYLSAKQLTRIFTKFEGISPGEYITKRRVARIEKLILEDCLSLKQISELMNFNNEYYFNTFFRNHAGMPPGEYRKMFGK